jgi:hypothetical protein
MVLLQDQYPGRKLDRFRDRRDICERDERILDWHVIAARHLAVLAAGIWQVFNRHCDVLDSP